MHSVLQQVTLQSLYIYYIYIYLKEFSLLGATDRFDWKTFTPPTFLRILSATAIHEGKFSVAGIVLIQINFSDIKF